MDEEEIPCLEGVPCPGVVGAKNTLVWSSLDSFLDNGLITCVVISVGRSHVKANVHGFCVVIQRQPKLAGIVSPALPLELSNKRARLILLR